MRVISLTQPWASLVVHREKRVETRSWKTGHTGPLAIHASVSFPKDCRNLCEWPHFFESLQAIGAKSWKDLPKGQIVGAVNLVCCKPTRQVREALSDKEREFGDYGWNRWAWFLADAQALTEPIEVKGALGLWDFQAGGELLDLYTSLLASHRIRTSVEQPLLEAIR